MLKRLINRLNQVSIDRLHTHKLITTLFANKSVAIVGSSPEIFNKEFGALIDSHDIVIHINLLNTKGKEQYYGTRTDVRFIGATLTEKHKPYLPYVINSPIILTSLKNKQFLDKINVKAFYFGSSTPNKALKFIDDYIDDIKFFKKKIPPPRSGIFLLSIILRFGNPASISLFGMSKTISNAFEFVSFANFHTNQYDQTTFSINHCDPKIEIDLLNYLELNNIIKIYT